ncbi:MAG: hypothetical protein AB8B57_15555 [Congregibacter sp.]
MGKAVWTLGFFGLLVASVTADAQTPSCAAPLFATDWSGTVSHGSEAALVKAAASGVDLKVGWALDFNGDGLGDITHWSDARFITVFENKVFAQVEQIHRQQPVVGEAEVKFPDTLDIWHGLIGSDGFLRSKFAEAGSLANRRVLTVWCPSKEPLPAPVSASWEAVYISGADGEAVSGSKQALFDAVRAGHPIRVGWGLSRLREGEVLSVEHTANPVFLTINNSSELVVQLPEHVAQRSYWDSEQAFFDDPAVMWRGVISTRGTFDAVWTNRATGEVVRRSPQRALFRWYVQRPPRGPVESLAIEKGIRADETRLSERQP